MKIKHKKRFFFSMILLIVLTGAIVWGGITGVKAIINSYETSKLPMSENPNIKKVKDIISPEVLMLINDNEWGITASMIENHPLPETDTLNGNFPTSFALADGVFETQDENECSGFVTAYVLRFMGKEATGKSVYYSMPNEAMPNGYRLPVDIIDKLRSENVNSEFFTGDLKTLKSRLVATAKPIVVLVGKGFEWQHYMNFVGYNDDAGEMYFVDSNMESDENGDGCGNRTISTAEFERLWNNGLPILSNLYIAIK